MAGELGEWQNADFKATALENAGIRTNSDLPDDTRFLTAVTGLVQRRIAEQKPEPSTAKLSVFLLHPQAPSDALGKNLKRAPMLSNGRDELEGRLWFVSAAVMSGRYIELDKDNDDDLFRCISDELRLGNIPAIIFEPRKKSAEIRFYPKGLDVLEECAVFALEKSTVSLDEVFDIIDKVYLHHIVTPESQTVAGKLWEKASDFIPIQNAENAIQWTLMVGLQAALPTFKVRHEQVQVSGRLDIEIEWSDPDMPANVIRHAIIELKVLRSRDGSGKSVSENKTKEWVSSGLKQAAAYRDERKALDAALCCFDMRNIKTEEQCFDHIRDVASKLKVKLRVWYVYASSERYRNDIILLGN